MFIDYNKYRKREREVNLMKYQVTIYSEKYKPISTIITVEDTATKQEILNKGVVKIAQKRYWDKKDLIKYGYTKVKHRPYVEPSQG